MGRDAKCKLTPGDATGPLPPQDAEIRIDDSNTHVDTWSRQQMQDRTPLRCELVVSTTSTHDASASHVDVPSKSVQPLNSNSASHSTPMAGPHPQMPQVSHAKTPRPSPTTRVDSGPMPVAPPSMRSPPQVSFHHSVGHSTRQIMPSFRCAWGEKAGVNASRRS